MTDDQKPHPLDNSDPLIRAQEFLRLTEEDEKITPELALFLAEQPKVSPSDMLWMNEFPFREKMSAQDWRELWEKAHPIVHAYWKKFYGQGQQD